MQDSGTPYMTDQNIFKQIHTGIKDHHIESFNVHFFVPNNKKKTKTNESNFSHARHHKNRHIKNKLSLKSHTSLNFPIWKQLSFTV